MQPKQIISCIIIILFLGICVFAGIKESRAIQIDDKIKKDAEFYFSNTTISEDILRRAGMPVRQYVDEQKFKNFLMTPENYENFKKALGMYITIKAAETRIPNWCNKYYNMSNFQRKISNNFSEKKRQTNKTFEDAFGTQWEKAITLLYDNLYSLYKDKHMQQMETEFQGAKTQMAMIGVQLSRQDFCKKIASDPEYFINYEKERFYKEFREQ